MSPRALLTRRWLGLTGAVGFLVLGAALAGCSHTTSYTIAPSGLVTDDDFPAIRSRATQTVTWETGQTILVVHHPPGDDQSLDEALSLLRAPVDFLEQATGRSAGVAIHAYLAPLPETGAPAYSAQGRGDFVEVFFTRPGVRLLSIPSNRHWYFNTLTHELAHGLLAGLRIEDRWLDDGLPEYLESRFARSVDPAAERSRHAWMPPVAALERTPLEPWTMDSYDAMVELIDSDPERALHLGQLEAWRYAASEELVRRWMAAAAQAGIAQPVPDLLDRMQRLQEPVRWEQIRQLVRDQTGRELAEIARLSDQERSRACREAWTDKDSAQAGVQLHGLRVLALLGLPDGASSGELLQVAAGLQPDASYPTWQRLAATGQALARADRPELAADFVETVRQDGANLHLAVAPEVWGVLARAGHPGARLQLVALIGDTDVPLGVRQRADETLREISGRSADWSITATPAERQRSAQRWADLVAGN